MIQNPMWLVFGFFQFSWKAFGDGRQTYNGDAPDENRFTTSRAGKMGVRWLPF
jgi:hypothetical protein